MGFTTGQSGSQSHSRLGCQAVTVTVTVSHPLPVFVFVFVFLLPRDREVSGGLPEYTTLLRETFISRLDIYSYKTCRVPSKNNCIHTVCKKGSSMLQNTAFFFVSPRKQVEANQRFMNHA